MDRSEAIGNLAAALSKARAAFRPISKDRSAKIVSPKGSFSYTYADLATVVDATSAALSACEIAVMQPVTTSPGCVIVTTVLAHSSGEWISERMEWPVVSSDNRSIGSGITYARRHSLLAMVAAASTDEDDDAEAARGGDGPTEQYRNAPWKPPWKEVKPAASPGEDDPEGQALVERLTLSIALAKRDSDALELVRDELRSLPESWAKERLRQVYKEAINHRSSTAGSSGASSFQSPHPAASGSTGPSPAGPTTTATTSDGNETAPSGENAPLAVDPPNPSVPTEPSPLPNMDDDETWHHAAYAAARRELER